MNPHHRDNCIALGVPIAAIGGAWWYFGLFGLHGRVAFDGSNVGQWFIDLMRSSTFGPLVVVLPVLVLVGVIHAGLFLCVKAMFNPPRFWRHTGRHLAVTSGLAWLLTIALFVAFALYPK